MANEQDLLAQGYIYAWIGHFGFGLALRLAFE